MHNNTVNVCSSNHPLRRIRLSPTQGSRFLLVLLLLLSPRAQQVTLGLVLQLLGNRHHRRRRRRRRRPTPAHKVVVDFLKDGDGEPVLGPWLEELDRGRRVDRRGRRVLPLKLLLAVNVLDGVLVARQTGSDGVRGQGGRRGGRFGVIRWGWLHVTHQGAAVRRLVATGDGHWREREGRRENGTQLVWLAIIVVGELVLKVAKLWWWNWLAV